MSIDLNLATVECNLGVIFRVTVTILTGEKGLGSQCFAAAPLKTR